MAREYVLRTPAAPVELRIDYRRELNEQQYAAVTARPGPALVLAGAGAGKTRTLTYRVAWLLEHGVPPERILLLTFTNKSAREMMQRVNDLIGGDLSRLWGGTFHSVGLRILRRHADRLRYRPDFTVADREDTKDLLAACIIEAGVDVKERRFPKPEVLGEMFSMALNTGRPLADLVASDYPDFVSWTDVFTAVARRYADRKRESGLMDFDDLLALWLQLLRDHEDLREVYGRRFQHVLVDEYQDTNRLQAELLDRLTGGHGNLMAVGDDAQSIYSWRGANFANILGFPERHPDTQVFRIETNYRSTPEILSLANAALAANTRQFPKQLHPARPTGPKPALVVCNDASEQANFVAQRVLELRDEGRRLDDICVLYRSHFHALEIQLELTRRNIPFFITSGLRFFEQAHIKDVAAYLKLVTNPRDELAFKRLVRMLPGIGSKGADKLWQRFHAALGPAAEMPVPAAAVSDNDGAGDAEVPLDDPDPIPVAPALSAVSDAVPKKTAAAWAQFSTTIAQCEAPEVRRSPAALIRRVVEADYAEYLKATYDNARNRLEDLDQLANYAAQFAGCAEFLSQLALQTNLEAEEGADRTGRDDEERLRLSTVHQAKGLEFGAVFVVMLCEGLFPSGRSLEILDALEEERRLFYVATTRAKDELYLLYPLMRSLQGSLSLQQRSRFLSEIPKPLVDEWNLRPTPAWAPTASAEAPEWDPDPADPEVQVSPDDEPF
ncbi:MAG: ATP-dependent helicase [Verrucomicrobia bacterium]|nr:ATP-dependent helicase [Verrucomicrobiota bacterium]